MRLTVSDVSEPAETRTPEEELLDRYPYLQLAEVRDLVRQLLALADLPASAKGMAALVKKYRHNGDDLWACINRIIFGDNRPVEQVNRYCPEYILTHKGQRPAVRCNDCRRERCKTEVRPSECPGLPVIDERLNCYEWMPQAKERVRTNPRKREAIMDKTALFTDRNACNRKKTTSPYLRMHEVLEVCGANVEASSEAELDRSGHAAYRRG